MTNQERLQAPLGTGKEYGKLITENSIQANVEYHAQD